MYCLTSALIIGLQPIVRPIIRPKLRVFSGYHSVSPLFPMPRTSPSPPPPAEATTSGQRALRSKTTRVSDDSDKKARKLKDVDISFPIVYGTMAFSLGKKATEYNSHRWTVYLRGATNEDLTVIIKRVVFQLHPSFNNPTRAIESPPFEVTETGWGEFEIAITLFFHTDVCDKRLDLYHPLKLFPEEDAGTQHYVKKPVVVETYDEIVFSEPTEAFFLKVQNHPAAVVPRLPASFNLPPPGPIEHVSERRRGDTKDHHLSQWYTNFSEADELLKLAAARQQVQAHIMKLRRQLSVLEGTPQQSKAASGQ